MLKFNEPFYMAPLKAENTSLPQFKFRFDMYVVCNDDWLITYENTRRNGGVLYKLNFSDRMWRPLSYTGLPSDMIRVSMVLTNGKLIIHGVQVLGGEIEGYEEIRIYETYIGDLSEDTVHFSHIGLLDAGQYECEIATDGTYIYSIMGVKVAVGNLIVYRIPIVNTDRSWEPMTNRYPSISADTTIPFTENRFLIYNDELYLFPSSSQSLKEYYSKVWVFNLESRLWREQTPGSVGHDTIPDGDAFPFARHTFGNALTQHPTDQRYAFLTGFNAEDRRRPKIRETWRIDLVTLRWMRIPFRGPGFKPRTLATAISPSGRMYCVVRTNEVLIGRVWHAWVNLQPTRLQDLCWETVRHHYGTQMDAIGLPQHFLDRHNGNTV